MSNPVTVYVVDDDDSIRKSMVMILDSARLANRSYASAEEFLNDFDAAGVGCLLLDLSMPGMSGLELLRHIRAKGVKLPVLVISGTASVGSAVEAMKLDVIDFLEKPADHHVVLAKV